MNRTLVPVLIAGLLAGTSLFAAEVGAGAGAGDRERKEAAAKQSRCFYCLGQPRMGEKPEEANLDEGARTFIVWPDGYMAHVRCVGNPIQEKDRVSPRYDLSIIPDCTCCQDMPSATEVPFVIFAKVGKNCGHSMCLTCYLTERGDECPMCRTATSKRGRYRFHAAKEAEGDLAAAQAARARYKIDRHMISSRALEEERNQKQSPYIRGGGFVDRAHTADMRAVDMKKEMALAAAREEEIAKAAAAKGLYKCVQCHQDITERQIADAKPLDHCNTISWSRGGGDLDHHVHGGACSQALVRLGECASCKRNLLDREERACAPDLAADAAVIAAKRGRRAAELTQARARKITAGKTAEQIDQEEFEEALRLSLAVPVPVARPEKKARVVPVAAAAVAAVGAGAGAGVSPEDMRIQQLANNFGCRAADLPVLLDCSSLDALKAMIRAGRI